MIPLKLTDKYSYKLKYDLNNLIGALKSRQDETDDFKYYLKEMSSEEDCSYLYLTVDEYSFAMQGLKNSNHIIHKGILNNYDPSNIKDYIHLASGRAFPRSWFDITPVQETEAYDFTNVPDHFFMKCENLTELNIVVNLAESKGYKLKQFTFDTFYLEMQITKKGF